MSLSTFEALWAACGFGTLELERTLLSLRQQAGGQPHPHYSLLRSGASVRAERGLCVAPL